MNILTLLVSPFNEHHQQWLDNNYAEPLSVCFEFCGKYFMYTTISQNIVIHLGQLPLRSFKSPIHAVPNKLLTSSYVCNCFVMKQTNQFLQWHDDRIQKPWSQPCDNS